VIEMNNPFYNGRTTSDIFILSNKKDFLKADGWELLKMDFGKITYNPYPYFILVNRYSGLLRMYIHNIFGTGENNSYTVTLQVINSLTGTAIVTPMLHSPNAKYDYSLADFSAGNVTKDPVDIAVFSKDVSIPEGTWCMAEFNLGYDPVVLANRDTYVLDIKAYKSTREIVTADITGTAFTKDMSFYGTKSTATQGSSSTTPKFYASAMKIQTRVNDINGTAQEFGQKAVSLSKKLDSLNKKINKEKFSNRIADLSKKMKKIGESPIFQIADAVTGGLDFAITGLTLLNNVFGFANSTTNSGTNSPIASSTFTDFNLKLKGEITTTINVIEAFVTLPGANTTNITGQKSISYFNCAVGALALKNTPIIESVEYPQYFSRMRNYATRQDVDGNSTTNGSVLLENQLVWNYDDIINTHGGYRTIVKKDSLLEDYVYNIKASSPPNSYPPGNTAQWDTSTYFYYPYHSQNVLNLNASEKYLRINNKTYQDFKYYRATNDLQFITNSNAQITDFKAQVALVAEIPESYLLYPLNTQGTYYYFTSDNQRAEILGQYEFSNALVNDLLRGDLTIYDYDPITKKYTIGTQLTDYKNFKNLSFYVPKDNPDTIVISCKVVYSMKSSINNKNLTYYGTKLYKPSIMIPTFNPSSSSNMKDVSKRPNPSQPSVPYSMKNDLLLQNKTIPNYFEDATYSKTWVQGYDNVFDATSKEKYELINHPDRPLRDVYNSALNLPYYAADVSVTLKNVVINPFDKFLSTPIEIEINRYNGTNYNLNFGSYLYNRVAVPLKIQAGAYIDILEGTECYATGVSCTEFMVSPRPWVVTGGGTYLIDNTYSCVMANQYNNNSILRWSAEETTNSEAEITVSPNPTSDLTSIVSNLK
ncbi:MAG: hypothetical protein RLZZ546_3337, partial [Bacteroidota bacterium]